MYLPHQSIDFAVHTIRPWLVRIEQAMNKALFTDSEKGHFYVQFNIDGLMRGDYKSRMEGYAIGRQNGWMSANDIRALENMNPIPVSEGGNDYLINGNMIPIQLAGLTAALVAAMQAAQAPAEGTDQDTSQDNDQDNNQDGASADQPTEQAAAEQPLKKKRTRKKRKEEPNETEIPTQGGDQYEPVLELGQE